MLFEIALYFHDLHHGKGERQWKDKEVKTAFGRPCRVKINSHILNDAYKCNANFSSERIHKSNISGVNLTEAKHINLSLHYLEHVILALSQAKRTHVPYRNSMMTYMLRDSLSGNCLTSMLATLNMNVKNLEVRISISTSDKASRKNSLTICNFCIIAAVNEKSYCSINSKQKTTIFLM